MGLPNTALLIKNTNCVLMLDKILISCLHGHPLYKEVILLLKTPWILSESVGCEDFNLDWLRLLEVLVLFNYLLIELPHYQITLDLTDFTLVFKLIQDIL